MIRLMTLPIVLFVAAIILLILVARAVKRRATADDEPDGPVWTAGELIRMRDSGALTIEQYERLRSRLVDGYRPHNGGDRRLQ